MKGKFPARVGRYEIVGRLGTGGMAVVYLANDPLLRRTVAIKILPEQDDELRERFAREARSAAGLRHNNIVTIYDIGEDDGRPFIAMEFVDGESLADMIRRGADVPLDTRLGLIIELCEGLGYAHRNSVIHRDIKPANLMISSEGPLKILDFGLARMTNATQVGLTRAGALMGTPYYMSPEQIASAAVDHRSDIFSVGLVLYEIISYRRAFGGKAAHQVLDAIINSNPPPLSSVVPGLDRYLERVVNRAIEKDARRRYQDLRDLAGDLEQIRSRLSAEAEAPPVESVGRPDRPERPSRRSGVRAAASEQTFDPSDDAHLRAVYIEKHLASGAAQFDVGKYKGVIQECEAALQLDPHETRALELLARARSVLNDRQMRDLLAQARAQLNSGALTEAEALVGNALELDADSVEARQLREEIRTKHAERERAASRVRALRSTVDRARRSLTEGAFQAAVRSAAEALAYDAEDAEAKAIHQQAIDALETQRRQKEIDAAATAIVVEARARASRESFTPALRLLSTFSPPHPLVEDAIRSITAEQELFEERLRRENVEREKQHRKQEAARHRQMEDDEQGAADPLEETQLASISLPGHESEAVDHPVASTPVEADSLRASVLAAREAAETAAREAAETAAREAAEAAAREAAEAAARIREQVEQYLLQGRSLLQEERLDDAMAAVTAAVKLEADSEEANALLAEIRVRQAAARIREQVEQHLLQGRSALQEERLDDAMAAVTAAVKLQADSEEGNALLAEIRAHQAAARIREQVEQHVLRARSALQQERLDDAMAAVTAAVALQPDSEEAKALLAELRARQAAVRAAQRDAALRAAASAAAAYRYDEALQVLSPFAGDETVDQRVASLEAEKVNYLEWQRAIDDALTSARGALSRAQFDAAGEAISRAFSLDPENRDAAELKRTLATVAPSFATANGAIALYDADDIRAADATIGSAEATLAPFRDLLPVVRTQLDRVANAREGAQARERARIAEEERRRERERRARAVAELVPQAHAAITAQQLGTAHSLVTQLTSEAGADTALGEIAAGVRRAFDAALGARAGAELERARALEAMGDANAALSALLVFKPKHASITQEIARLREATRPADVERPSPETQVNTLPARAGAAGGARVLTAPDRRIARLIVPIVALAAVIALALAVGIAVARWRNSTASVQPQVAQTTQTQTQTPPPVAATTVPPQPPDPPPPVAVATGTLRVDLRPWARVSIKPVDPEAKIDVEAQVTPFTISLPEGEYILEARNDGLTRTMQFNVRVTAGKPTAVTRVMPGFDPQQTVDALLAGER